MAESSHTKDVIHPQNARWVYRQAEGNEFDISPEQLAACEDSPIIARLLIQRGIDTPEAMAHFLRMEDYTPTSPMELPNMATALERIGKALDDNQSILIYGDFDVDGQTGTSILTQTLKDLGAQVSFYVPDRATEGHGMNSASLLRLVSARKVKLVITTDTGIGSFNEISLLNGLGVDTIVTDHHENPENLPPAVACVTPKLLEDPHHPLAHLSGAGVAYKLCEALVAERGDATLKAQYPDAIIDLAAIGIVCDIMPLIGENRYLVWKGLGVLAQRKRLGLRTILEHAGVGPDKPLNTETMGFTLGPRLNAIGRLSVATEAVELLTTDDPERADILATKLEHLNRKRQELCEKTYLEAEQFMNATGGLGDRKVIALASPDWHPGIVGIVASRLVEKYRVPTMMMVVEEDKGKVRGSARSIPGFAIHTCLQSLERFFLHYGGHAGAGGFALEMGQLDSFRNALYEYCGNHIRDDQLIPEVVYDDTLQWSQANLHLVHLLDRLAPFGEANPAPRFAMSALSVGAQRAIGQDQRHLKVILHGPKGTGVPMDGLIWNAGGLRFDRDQAYDVVARLEENSFGDREPTVQLMLEAWAPSHRSPLSGITPKPVKTTATPKTQAPTDPTPTQSVASTTSVGALPEEVLSPGASHDGIRWVDHRQRESVDRFVGQWMLPNQTEESVLLFHEGRTPTIPMLQQEWVCHRHNLYPAKTLILWDFPPDSATFQRIIHQVQPEIVHVVGGKYQNAPLFLPAKTVLKGTYQLLKRHLADIDPTQPTHGTLELSLNQLAFQAATTESAMACILMVLQDMELIGIGPTPGEADGFRQSPWTITLPEQPSQPIPQHQRPAYQLLEHHLATIGRFRNWLLDVPLDRMRAFIMTGPLDAGHPLSDSALSSRPSSAVEAATP